MRHRIVAVVLGILVVGAGITSLVVERESRYVREDDPVAAGQRRALVLYHPSRDAGFADELALALRDGLREAGLAVDLATATSATPTDVSRYVLVGVVANTYWWSPDRPTMRWLRRVRLDGLPVVGVIGGAGSTGRSERLLREGLAGAGGRVVAMQSAWLWKPNDEARMQAPNRAVARDLVRALGVRAGGTIPAR